MPMRETDGTYYTEGHCPWPVPLQSRACHVYALFCEGVDDQGFIKLGHSTRIGQRLSALLTGCPLAVKMIGVIEFGMQIEAVRVETALHNQFVERNTRGEWFQFDFKSAADKAAFNDGCRRVFAEHGVKEWWTKISTEALRKHGRRQQMAHLRKSATASWGLRQERLARMQASDRVFIKTE